MNSNKPSDPEMDRDVCGWPESRPVLGWYRDEWIKVKLEQIDEDCQPQWYTCDSEHWSMNPPETWVDLPPPPILNKD